MSRTPKPGSGDAATDKTPSGAATGESRIEPLPVNLTINGLARTITVEPRLTLLEALRENLALTGTKKACDRGECGACTVHVDGRRVLSCMTLAAMIEEAKAGWPSAATADLGRPFTLADLSRAEIRERMSGNLCRCACYPNIVDAVVEAVARS